MRNLALYSVIGAMSLVACEKKKDKKAAEVIETKKIVEEEAPSDKGEDLGGPVEASTLTPAQKTKIEPAKSNVLEELMVKYSPSAIWSSLVAQAEKAVIGNYEIVSIKTTLDDSGIFSQSPPLQKTFFSIGKDSVSQVIECDFGRGDIVRVGATAPAMLSGGLLKVTAYAENFAVSSVSEFRICKIMINKTDYLISAVSAMNLTMSNSILEGQTREYSLVRQ
jgi:hypothetical protein